MILDGDELNFFKQVVIEVFQQKKCKFINVYLLLNLFRNDETQVSMNEKRKEYEDFYEKNNNNKKMKN